MSPDASDRAAPIVTFLSDYGYDDEFVGVCHCVIARRCPAARIIDLGHGLAHRDVRAGALALRAALRYAPAGVHLAVVDPGVGSDRRALAMRTCDQARILVGPDNGLLLPAAAAFGDGVPMAAVGRTIGPETLVALELPAPSQERDAVHAHVLSIDGFGNVALDVEPATVTGAASLLLEVGGGQSAALLGHTFADVPPGELVAYTDSRGCLALAVNCGSAAARLGVGVDDELVLRAR